MTWCLAVGFASAGGAQEFDGRYLLSLFHVDVSGQTQDRMNHLYDVVLRQETPNGWKLDLGTALRYDSEFSYDSDIFRARTFGELQGGRWRLHGQFVPWQRIQPSTDLPSRRDLQLGLTLNPPDIPQIRLNYTRADQRTLVGESRTDDGRIEIDHDFGPVLANAGYRHIESDPAGRATKSSTNEYRGGLQANKAWGGIGISGAYDAIVTDIHSAARVIDQQIQRANADLSWRPTRNLVVSGNGLRRWGRTSDNAQYATERSAETSLGANVSYVPVLGLNLSATRNYRKSRAALGDQRSDYLVLQALYRRQMLRRTVFHTGYSQSIDLASENGNLPNSSAFASVDGELRRDVWLRAESRAARSSARSGALQWFWLLQTRMRPVSNTTLEVIWNRNSYPEVMGLQQIDRTLEVKAAYSPQARSSLVATYRRLDGKGRIDNRERAWGANASLRVQDQTTLNLYGSRRRSGIRSIKVQEDVVGLDVTLQPRDRLHIRNSVRYAKINTERRDITYGMILTRNF